MPNIQRIRRFSLVPLALLGSAIIGIAGCGGGTSSSPAIPFDAPNGPARAAALMAQLDPAAVNISGSGPWKTVPLGYTPTLLLSAVLSANSSVWFADDGANSIGVISASGTTARYDAGSYIFSNPTGPPTVYAASPTDVEAGPNQTTYYAAAYGYGIMSASGTATLYDTYCYSNCGNSYLTLGEATQMAVSTDGSAWFGAQIFTNASPPVYTPVIARAIGPAVATIVVPGWNSPSNYNPAWLTMGPDGNVWFSDGQAIGTINVTNNAVTMYDIPAQFINSNGWAGDITSGPDGALWVSYVNGPYLLRASISGVITAFSTPPSFASFNGDQSSHGLTSGPGNAIYAANGGSLISSFNTLTSQFSTYNWPTSGNSGAQTITAGADQNIWVFNQDPKVRVFLPHSTISSVPSSFKLKAGAKAKIHVKEGKYSGMFTVSATSGNCAGATPASSSGTFTIQTASGGTSPCFIGFSDTIGNGTVYAQVTVTP